MIKKFNLFITFVTIIFLFNSCGAVKEGFSSQKKNNKDEFLVEKKSPLLMPPDYNDLPVPNSEDVKNKDEDNQVKKLITKSNTTDSNFNKSNNSKSSFDIPFPLSLTSISVFPESRILISIFVDLASMEFSTNSFRTEAGLCTTSPAAILFITSLSKCFMLGI